MANSDDKQLGLDPILVHGARAVRAGLVGEVITRSIFESYRVKVVKDNRVFHNPGGDLWIPAHNQILIPQYAHRSDLKFDYMYINFKRNIYLPIECKNQMSAGTTDQKLADLIDILGQCDFPAFWIILTGGGFNPKVTKRMYDKVRALKNIRGKLIFNEGALLVRAIERLVEHGET